MTIDKHKIAQVVVEPWYAGDVETVFTITLSSLDFSRFMSGLNVLTNNSSMEKMPGPIANMAIDDPK